MKKQTQNVKFAFIKINTDQFAIIDSAFKKEDNVNFKIGLQFGANRDNCVISVKTSILFVQNEDPFMIIEASCFFKIEPNDWKTLEHESEIIVPKNIITHFSVLSVGTVRGILHSKTEGTNFNGFVVPTINITELVTDDVRL